MPFSAWRTEKWENGSGARLSWCPRVSPCLFSRAGPGQGVPVVWRVLFPSGPQLVPLGLVVSLGCPSSWLLPRGVGLPSPPISSLPLTLLSLPGPGLIVMELGGLWVGRAGQERVGSSVLPQRLGGCSGAGSLPGPWADTCCNLTALGLRSRLGVRPRVRPRPEQLGGPCQGTTQPSPVLSAPSPRSAWRSSP